MPTRRPASERFWEKVNKDGAAPPHASELGPCWLWTAATDTYGYGAFGSGVGKQVTKAHVWAWVALVGPVPAGLELDHLCRVRNCVNPAHLEPVTHGVNISRARRARTHCKRGHDLADARIRERDGARICRECSREHQRAHQERKLAALT